MSIHPSIHHPSIFICSKDVSNKFATGWQQVVLMEFGKRRDTTDTMDFKQTDRRTDRRQYDANSRLYSVAVRSATLTQTTNANIFLHQSFLSIVLNS